MEIKKVTDEAFRKYGRVLEGIDFTQLLEALEKTPCPEGTVYVASEPILEATDAMEVFGKKVYGEMPIQIGYCNGHNRKLNALEYHRDSELNIAGTDAVLIVGLRADVTDEMTYDTSKAEAFLLPAGMGVEVFATTLHYAPAGPDGNGFRVVVVLPRGTNFDLAQEHKDAGEDSHLTAVNKWLLGHPEGGLPEGSPMGLIGENLSI